MDNRADTRRNYRTDGRRCPILPLHPRKNWKGWDGRSPLARVFNNWFQGNEPEWVRYHRLAQSLAGVANLDLLIKDLGSPLWRKYVAAAQTLEFSGRLHHHGHTVQLVQNTHLMSTDARVTLAERPADFLPPALIQVDAVADALIDIINSGSETLRELPGGSGTARISKANQNVASLRSPVVQHDDLSRVLDKLQWDWVRQLATVQGPTLLVALSRHLFLEHPSGLAQSIGETIVAVSVALRERPMIGGILLHEESFMPQSSPLIYCCDQFRFVMGGSEGHDRTLLFIPNPNANVPLSSEEFEPLVGPNMQW